MISLYVKMSQMRERLKEMNADRVTKDAKNGVMEKKLEDMTER